MAQRLFVDTSYVLALYNTSDEFHLKAKAMRPLTHPPHQLVTTEAVLLEIGNALSKRAYRRKGSLFIRGFYSTPNMIVVPLTTQLLLAGLKLYERRPDKEWGLVDCISFVVMGRHRLRAALSADDHFIQAGFRALLLEDGFIQ